MNLIARIKASMPALSPAEKQVAALVLADPRLFVTQPVGTLAGRAGVSKPTVVRFCRSLGCDGLSDFKLKLAGNVNEGVPFVHRAVDEGDGTAELVVKVIDNAVSAMLKFRNDAGSANFEQAIDALERTIRAGGRIEFKRHGQTALGQSGGQHQSGQSGRTAGRDIARNGRLEGYGPAPDEKSGLLSDARRRDPRGGKHHGRDAVAREIVLIQPTQRR